MHLYNSLGVFLLGFLALIIPSGYSVGAVMLLVGSVFLFVSRPFIKLSYQDWLIIGTFLFYTFICILEVWWDGQGSRGFDKPSRFLLAVPVILIIIAYPPRLSWLWSGLALGAIGAGSWAAWQKLVEGVWRATGYTYVIQFGNLSMLMGIMCLAGLGWAWIQPRRIPWLVFLLIGTIMGMLGSLFSGSRGGWIGLPFLFLVLYRGYGCFFPRIIKGGLLSMLLVVAVSIYVIPQTGVQSRIHEAVDDVKSYVYGERGPSSLGDRFEMWKGATHLILEKPLIGWGENGYQHGMKRLADDGVIKSYIVHYGHPHNEFLNSWAKRGFFGLVALILIYFIPIRFFSRELRNPDMELRSIAVAGVLLPVAYIDFGFTQSFLTHNSGVMMFAFWLAILWGSFSVRLRLILSPK